VRGIDCCHFDQQWKSHFDRKPWMTALELIEFPADRTLAEAREDWLTVVSGPINLSAGLRESPARALALAVMLIFARFTDQTRLQLRAAVAEDADQPLVFVADVAPELPLSEALRRTRAEAGPAPAPVVNIVLEGASARWSGDTEGAARLRFDVAGDELTLTFAFDAARIAAVTARDFLEKIAVVLAALEARPDLACGDLELIGAEARALLPDLARRIETRPYRAVAAQFFDAAARHGDQPAVTNGPHTYRYADLSAAVRVLAGQLREAGVQPGDVVAVSGLSSFGMLAGMLAVLTAGGVLVTLDRSLPEARQDLIRQVSDPRLVIEVGPATDGAMGGAIRCVDWPMADQIARLHAAAPPLAAVMVEPAVDAAAYIFFTSGSTGLPKGVLGSQLGLAHFLTWQRENFPIGPGDRASQLTALSFDVVLRDVLFPLTSGACLHIPARELVLDARRMLGWIEGNRITVMHAVPSLMKAWLQAHLRGMPFASLRYVFFAGEPLTDTLLRQVRQVTSEQAVFVNLYGPTETTLAKLSHRIDRVEPGVQPVGLPQPGAEVVILRDRRLRCGLWEVGEIAIRTPYRSKGYFRNEALTDSVFLPNPQGGEP
jgi:non-ribosomal peptide synthetase component F